MGIIIGAGIYQTAPDVARSASSEWGVLGIWVLGGFLSLCGALCYAELATAYPRQGGDYVYLTQAYGKWAGFLFGWLQLLVVRPGDIAVMAFAFATYGLSILPESIRGGESHGSTILASGAVAILTIINAFGVKQGKWTQNLLTVAKLLGILVIVIAALAFPAGDAETGVSQETYEPTTFSLALILVLFTYGGWNEMAYVAAEARDPKRNIARALLVGTLGVTFIYVLINGAFLKSLGFAGVASSTAVATDSVATAFPGFGERVIAILICISALGAVNGLVFTGARISYAVGQDHRLFRNLGEWDQGRGTPAKSLLFQGVLAIVLIVALGSFMNAVIYTAAAVYLFYLATCLAVVILRIRDPKTERPFKTPLYPLPIAVFGSVCVFLIYGAIAYKPMMALVTAAIVGVGGALYFIGRRSDRLS